MADSKSTRRFQINFKTEEALGHALIKLGFLAKGALDAPWAEFVRRAEAGERLGLATVIIEHKLATLDQLDHALEHVEKQGTQVHTRRIAAPARDTSADEELGRQLLANNAVTSDQLGGMWREFQLRVSSNSDLRFSEVLLRGGVATRQQLLDAGADPADLPEESPETDPFSETSMDVDPFAATRVETLPPGGLFAAAEAEAASAFADTATWVPEEMGDPFAAFDASASGGSGSGSTDLFAGAEAAAMEAAAAGTTPLEDSPIPEQNDAEFSSADLFADPEPVGPIPAPAAASDDPPVDMQGEELLGRALWSAGVITVEELDGAWKQFVGRAQAGEDVRFGQVLIERGTLQPQQLIDIAQKIEAGELRIPPRIDVLKNAERQAKALIDAGVPVEDVATAWQEFMDRAAAGEDTTFAEVAEHVGVASKPAHSDRMAAVVLPEGESSFFDINLATDDLPDSISSVTKKIVPEDLRASIRAMAEQVDPRDGLEALDEEEAPDAVLSAAETPSDVPNVPGKAVNPDKLEPIADTRALDLESMANDMKSRRFSAKSASDTSIDLSGLEGELGTGLFEDEDEPTPTANFAAEEEFGRALLAEGLITLEQIDVAWVEFEGRIEKGEDVTFADVLSLRGIVPPGKLEEVRNRIDAGESFHPPTVDLKAEERLGRALLGSRTVRIEKIDAAWQHFLDRVRQGEATSFAQELLEQGMISRDELLEMRDQIASGQVKISPRINLPAEEALGRQLIEQGVLPGEQVDEAWRDFVRLARSGEHVTLGGLLVDRGLVTEEQIAALGGSIEIAADEELPLVESFFDIALDNIEVPDSLSIKADLVPADVIESIRAATGGDEPEDAHFESLDDEHDDVEDAELVEPGSLVHDTNHYTQAALASDDGASLISAADIPDSDGSDGGDVEVGDTLEPLDEDEDDALELPEPVLPGYELPPTGVDTRSLNFGAIGAEFGDEMFTDENVERPEYDPTADEALGRALLVSQMITMDALDVAWVEFTDRMERGEDTTFDEVLANKYGIGLAAIADLRKRLAAGEEFLPQEIDLDAEMAFGRAVLESGRLGLKQIDRAWEDFRDRSQAGEPITFADAMVEKGLVDRETIDDLRARFDAGELQTSSIINYRAEEQLARALIEAGEINAETLDPVWQQFLTRSRGGEKLTLAEVLLAEGLVDADTLSKHSGEKVHDPRLTTFMDMDVNAAMLPATLLITPEELPDELLATQVGGGTGLVQAAKPVDEEEIPEDMFDDDALGTALAWQAETAELQRPADWGKGKSAGVSPSGRISAVAGISNDDLSDDQIRFYYEQEQHGLMCVQRGWIRAQQIKPVWEEMLDRIDTGQENITLLGLLEGYGVLKPEQVAAILAEGVPDADTGVRRASAIRAQGDEHIPTADREDDDVLAASSAPGTDVPASADLAALNPIGSLFLDASALNFALDDADAPDDFVFQEFAETSEVPIKQLPPITVNAGAGSGMSTAGASSTQHALPQPTPQQIEALYERDAGFLRQQEDFGFKAIDRKWLVADAIHPVWDEMLVRRINGDAVSDLPSLFVEHGILSAEQAEELRKVEASPQVDAAKKVAAAQPAGSLFIDASALDSALNFDEPDEFVMPELQEVDGTDSMIPDVQGAYTAPRTDESINLMAGDVQGGTRLIREDDRDDVPGTMGGGVNDSIAAQMTLFEIGEASKGIGHTEGASISSGGVRSDDGRRSGRGFGSFGTRSGSMLPPRTLGGSASGMVSDAGGAGIARQMGFGNLVDLSGKNKGFSERMGRYLITGRIGKGGMGEILNARDADLNRDLAMKVMLAGSDAKRSQLEKFLVEAQVTGQLEHPNIVPVHELGLTTDGRLYFTMKYVRGKSLQQILESMGEREADRAARKAARGTRGSRGSRSKADVSGVMVTAAATATGGVSGANGGSSASGSGTGTATGGASASGSGESSLAPGSMSRGKLAEATQYKTREYSLAELLEIYMKICDAVAFAHSRGVVHRDLKPENVMVGEFGEVQVMDWGLAKVRGKEDRVEAGVKIDLAAGDIGLAVRGEDADIDIVKTMDGTILGTPVYMPPEQARGDIELIDHRSDVYSLGAILYQTLTLKQPLTGRTAIEILVKVAKGDIQSPSQRAPERAISAELEAVVLKAMAPKMDKRYDTVEHLKSDVRAFLEGRALSAVSYSPMALAMKWVKRNKTLTGGIAAVILVAVGLIATFNYISESTKAAYVQARMAEAEEAMTEAEKLRVSASELNADTLASTTSAEKKRLAELLRLQANKGVAQVQKVIDSYGQALARDPGNEEVAALQTAAIKKQGGLGQYVETATAQQLVANNLANQEKDALQRREQAASLVAEAAALIELAAPNGVLAANGVSDDRFHLTEPRFDLLDKAADNANIAASYDPENPDVKNMVETVAALRTRAQAEWKQDQEQAGVFWQARENFGAAVVSSDEAADMRAESDTIAKRLQSGNSMNIAEEGGKLKELRGKAFDRYLTAWNAFTRAAELYAQIPGAEKNVTTSREHLLATLISLGTLAIGNGEFILAESWLGRGNELFAGVKEAQLPQPLREAWELLRDRRDKGQKYDEALARARTSFGNGTDAQYTFEQRQDYLTASISFYGSAQDLDFRVEVENERTKARYELEILRARERERNENWLDALASWNDAERLTDGLGELKQSLLTMKGNFISDATNRLQRDVEALLTEFRKTSNIDAGLVLLEKARQTLAVLDQINKGAPQAKALLAEVSRNEREVNAERNTPDSYVYIRGGNVAIGSNRESDRNPVITPAPALDSFYISKYEVTVGEYRRFVTNNGYVNRALWSDDGWKWLQELPADQRKPLGWDKQVEDRYPVVGVTAYEAEAYARWLSTLKPDQIYALPDEFQWETAARHVPGDYSGERLYPWGNSDWRDGGYTQSTMGELRPVGTNPSDVSGFKVRDMGGNVSEWVRSRGKDGGYGLRGASSLMPVTHARRYGLTTKRSFGDPTMRLNDTGFRVIRVITLKAN